MNRYYVSPQGRVVMYRNYRGDPAKATAAEFAVLRAVALGARTLPTIMKTCSVDSTTVARCVSRNWLEEEIH